MGTGIARTGAILTRVDPASFKDWRTRVGLTQQGLADAWRMNVRTIKGWEAGRSAIPFHVLYAMAAYEAKLKPPKGVTVIAVETGYETGPRE